MLAGTYDGSVARLYINGEQVASGTVERTIPASFTASETCQSRDFGNLYFVDGTTFPSLPAKNLTFSLMANAVRVADHAF